MKRTLYSLMIIAALSSASCGNDPGSSQAQETTHVLPADVKEVAEEIRRPVVAPETAVEESETMHETTGEFVSPSQSAVAPKVPGVVTAVHADSGDLVRRGQPLATIDTDYVRLDLQRAEAELARARSAEAEARRDLERKRELREKDSIPQSLYDRTLAAAEQATAGRQIAEAAVSMARQRIADSVIRSPLTGVVAERRVDAGEHLGEAGVAFVVNQTAPLRLRFSVPERYLGRVSRGQRVTAVVDPYPGEQFAGVIRTVGGVVDPSSRTILVEAEFGNADNRLRPGLFARVGLDLETGGVQ